MFCRNCGCKIPDNAKFCNTCGTQATGNPIVNTIPVQTILPNPPMCSNPCPKCKGTYVQFQTVTEARKTGCFTILLYILLAVTVFGLFIVIPLLLRKKTITVTYGVCQSCGHRWKV